MHASNNQAYTVVVRDLSKDFWVTEDGSERGFLLHRRGTKVEALRPVSFAASQGESIGIIGRNGSGKSTLLSMIAGTEQPSSGEVYTSSKPTLLSVGAALDPALSGVENVKMGLLAKGLRAKEAEAIKRDVAEWAEIGDAVDRAYRTYSSGMKARLKFAIATAVRPEILLVDEALSTGDETFNAKANKRMEEFLADASTVFIVSHSARTIQEHCDRAIWIHEGYVIADGPVGDVTKKYNAWSKAVQAKDRITAGKLTRRAKLDYQPPKILFDSEFQAGGK